MVVNSTANWIGYAVRIAVTFFLTPRLIHGLGDQRYGLWSLIESVLACLSLFDFGIAVSLVRYGARFEAQSDWRSLNRLYSTCLSVFFGFGVLILAIVLCLAFGWDRPLGAPPALAHEFRALLILLGINLAVGLPLGVYPTLLDALGQYPVKVAIRTSWSLLSSLLLLLFARAGYGLGAVGLVIIANSLGENLTMIVATHRYLPQLRFSPKFVNVEMVREIRRNSACAFLALIAGRMSFQIDSLVIGAFLAPQYITFFMIGARLVEFSKDAVRALTSPLTSTISAREAVQDTKGIRRSFLRGTRAMLWVTMLLQAGLMTLGQGFLVLWVGPSHARATFPVLMILAIPLTLSAAQLTAGRVLYGLGRLGFYAMIVAGEAVINLLLSLVLVQHYGIGGVALGTTLPNLVANCLVIVIVCRTVDVGIREYLVSAWLKPTSLGCALLTFWLALSRFMPVSTWRSFLSVGFLGTAIYAIAALWFELGANRMLQLLNVLFERMRIVLTNRVEVLKG
jgi:O-antigen/teichoic acid export membrane protein